MRLKLLRRMKIFFNSLETFAIYSSNIFNIYSVCDLIPTRLQIHFLKKIPTNR